MKNVAIRWSDNDRYWGPFTYANENKGRHDRRILGVYLTSGCEEYPKCSLRLHFLGHTLIAALPAVIKPVREWREIKTEPTRSKMLAQGRSPGYWQEWNNSFGFLFVFNSLHVDYGAQTHDSVTDKSKCYLLPWMNKRHVRHSFYGLSGEHVATLPTAVKNCFSDRERERRIKAQMPKLAFIFKDYDGEQLVATTMIEEREWRHGTGYFKWLSLFLAPTIKRSLDICFSGETGRRKGSWKGGTVGHSINMLPGELHEQAFRRYCIEHSMTFIGAGSPQQGARR